MLNLHLRSVLFVSVVAAPLGLFSQSPSETKSGNTNASASAPASKASCSYSPNPSYSKEARDAKFEGTVRVEAIIMPDGRVTNIRIVKSPGLGLDESILETLKTWKCTPATYNGKLVPTKVPIEINFRLGQKPNSKY